MISIDFRHCDVFCIKIFQYTCVAKHEHEETNLSLLLKLLEIHVHAWAPETFIYQKLGGMAWARVHVHA